MRSVMVLSAALVAVIAQTTGAQGSTRVSSTAASAPLVTLRQGGITTLGPSGARIHAETDRDAYLTVFALSGGELRLLYPRTPRATNRVRASQDVGVTVPPLQNLAAGSSDREIHVIAIASPVPFDFTTYRDGGRWKESRLIGYMGSDPDQVVETVADLLIPHPDVHYSYDVATYYGYPNSRYGMRRSGYEQCARYGSIWNYHEYDEAYYGDPYYFGDYRAHDYYYFLVPTSAGWYLSTPMYAHGYSRCGGSPIRFTIFLPPRRGPGREPGTGRPDEGTPRDSVRRVKWDSSTWVRPGDKSARAQPKERGTFSDDAKTNPRGKVTLDGTTTADRPAVTRTDESTGRSREIERKETPRRERPTVERAPEKKAGAQPARAEPARSAPSSRSTPSRSSPSRPRKSD